MTITMVKRKNIPDEFLAQCRRDVQGCVRRKQILFGHLDSQLRLLESFKSSLLFGFFLGDGGLGGSFLLGEGVFLRFLFADDGSCGILLSIDIASIGLGIGADISFLLLAFDRLCRRIILLVGGFFGKAGVIHCVDGVRW